MRRFSKLVICAVLLGLACTTAAWGTSIGVGTDTGRIKVDTELRAGGRYPLPAFRVGNTGTEGMGYVLKVAPLEGGQPVPPSWVTFEPEAAYLRPEQWVEVKATLVVPADASPGRYSALLAASPKLPEGMASANVNVGAGPRLEVQVVAGSPASAVIWEVRSWFGRAMPWSLIGVIVIALLVVGSIVFVLIRRSRRRRTRTDEGSEPQITEPTT